MYLLHNTDNSIYDGRDEHRPVPRVIILGDDVCTEFVRQLI